MTESSLRAATIEDVAREAGVSRAAVSKVIRNAYGVSASMRERVEAAIERLDYRPRTAARALRGASFTLGIEIPEFHNQFFTRIIEGATNALDGTGYQLVIAPAEANSGEGYRPLEALSAYHVDGIIAVSPLVAPAWLERLAERVPVVMLGRHDASEGYDTVAGDDKLGAGAVMDHFAELGHVRVAHLTRPEDVTRAGSGTPHAVRLAVYLDRMRAAGQAEEIRVLRTGPTEEEARLVTAALLDEPEPPTALFAAHDQLALGALRAASERGIPPERFSVVGYDDIALASHPALSLTTVDQDGPGMGMRAIELLLERLRGRREPVHHLAQPVLKVRRSSAPLV